MKPEGLVGNIVNILKERGYEVTRDENIIMCTGEENIIDITIDEDGIMISFNEFS